MTIVRDATLVVGAGGFIGKHLVRELKNSGHRVIAVSRHSIEPESSAIKYIVADLRTPEDVAKVINNCSKVVWLATASTPGASAGKPLDELQGNIQPLLSLLQVLQNKQDIDLLYVSSGGALYGDVAGGDAVEVLPLRPKSYYGAGKASAEHFITALGHQFGRSAVILRPSNIYGPGQFRRNEFGIVPTAFERLINDQTLTIWGDGKTIRDYLYIDDFISLCLKVLENPMLPGTQVFNAASGKGTHLNYLLDLIEEISGIKLGRTYQHGRAVDVRRIVLNNKAATEHYAWKPNIQLYEGLKRTWTWFKALPL